MLILCLLIFISQGFVDCVVNCNDQANGNYEITCTKYTECSHGVATVHNCSFNQMYNPETKRCGAPSVPCNIQRDCNNLDSNRYPDLETNCTSYYTCHNGVFYGHNFCNSGLVYDGSGGICNWPYNVVEPCGTIPVFLG
ncbi:uncharacterized protein LOC117333028 isoform X2 [Pecten maximus]|uniref:uncharacterized protein LOC117333028 isoform X2 n=1 Tax=Pecten maximus TaxID=6579 RepID=UPI001458026B|nr:uncharacterized protein LOC117333028 isoform X2 [Pecten maximus]